MNDYSAIAGVYDRINSGVDYENWADGIEHAFERYLTERPTLVLDLACGTGRMTNTLARRGYDMIGVDRSGEMLARAADAVYELIDEGRFPASAPRPLYLCQDMRELELYGTVGAAVCCLDSLNYLVGDGELFCVLDKLANYIDTDGLLMFDMNTPYKFEHIYADESYAYDMESDGCFCVWQNYYDREGRICDFLLTVFAECEDGRYTREDESQQERCYSLEEIKKALESADFELLEVASDPHGAATADTTERWYFTARNKRKHKC